MYKKISVLISIISLFFLIPFYSYSDVRKENIELYLVVDKSKSMVEEISDVSSYINKYFIDDFLIPGDRLVLIEFYGQADLVFDEVVTEQNKSLIMSDISKIPADGRFTDIGNALDRLNNAVNAASAESNRKYLILLTDGKQEAPPESPYYTPDGSFNHRFLKNTKVIQRAGWKIMILGIGDNSAVKQLAEELATTGEVLNFDDSLPVQKNASEIIGRILSDNFSVDKNKAYIRLKSEGYTQERGIIIEQITYQLYSGNYPLLDEPVSITIRPDAQQIFELELSDNLLNLIKNDGQDGSIIFKFSGDTPFLPAVFDNIVLESKKTAESEIKIDDFSEKSENNSFNWLIIVIIILIAAAVVAFIIIRNTILHRDDGETKKRKKDAISDDS